MTEENIEQEVVDTASESLQPAEDVKEQEQKMVPLAALEAERKKRQFYEEELSKRQKPAQEEDLDSLVEKRTLNQVTAQQKREILEELYQDMNPKHVQEISKYLKPILEQKPWLAASVDSAPNRYARAHEIVQDYMHLVSKEKSKDSMRGQTEGQRIVQNSQKPRSPAEVGKAANPGGVEFLKSIQGGKEFREYRQQVMGKR